VRTNPEQLQRVLDANRNRAVEALRVVEDGARFVLGAPTEARRLKALRAELAGLFRHAALEGIIAGRDVDGDTGHPVNRETKEAARSGLGDLLGANFSRAKEALRVLEEYSKLLSPTLAASFEKLRYGVYQSESELLGPRLALRSRLREEPLCLLLSPGPGRPKLREMATAALAGGCGFFQLRLKSGSDRERFNAAAALADTLKPSGALLVINDRVDIAAAVPGAGVHLGQDDLPAAVARSALSWDRPLGLSTHDEEEFRSALMTGPDYLGLGTIFASGTKPELSGRGLALVQELAGGSPVAVFGIGGITTERAGSVIAAGASGVAVSGAILDSGDIETATRVLISAVHEARAEARNGSVDGLDL